MNFYTLPPLAKTYPKSVIPMLPTLGTLVNRSTAVTNPIHFQSRFLKSDALSTYKGRYAIFQALELCKKLNSSIGSVLMPAYHCPSMIEPAILANLQPLIYQLGEKLQPGIENLKSQIRKDTGAIVLVHYFGVVNDYSKIIDWARNNRILVLEDCAHAFGAVDNPLIPGTQGDLAIASSAKFFPGGHGGRLITNLPCPAVPLVRPGSLNDIRDLKRILTTKGKNIPRPPTEEVRDRMDRKPQDSDLYQPLAKVTKESLRWCKDSESGLRNTRTLDVLLKLTSFRQMVSRRREIYKLLSDCVSSRPDMDLFLVSQPDIPYVVPVRLKCPTRQFPWLKYAGLPMWRWEEVAESDCKFTDQLKNSLIQLPCHQTITNTQVDWMIRTIQSMPVFAC